MKYAFECEICKKGTDHAVGLMYKDKPTMMCNPCYYRIVKGVPDEFCKVCNHKTPVSDGICQDCI